MIKRASLVAAILALFVPAAGAQGDWGLRGGVTFDPDQVHVGAHVYAGELFDQGYFVPNLEVGFGDHLTLITLNPELVYRFQKRSSSRWGFYIGGGLGINIVNWDDDHDLDHDDHDDWHHGDDDLDAELGLNILGGMARALSSGNELFFELKLGLVDSPDAKLTLGLTFD